MTNTMRRAAAILASLMSLAMITGCSAAQMSFDDFARAWNGVPGTFRSYDENSQMIDEVKGTSFRIERDTRFDRYEYGTDGNSHKVAGDVMLISLGNGTMSHVGSSALLAQDGLSDITLSAPAKVEVKNTDRGTPWLNSLYEHNRNLWAGKAKTIMIRSQNGTPLAVYAGSQVEMVGTAVPKSTMFRIDGRYLWAYRVDYTVYDTALLAAK